MQRIIIKTLFFSVLGVGTLGNFINTCRDLSSSCIANMNNCMNPAYYNQCRKTCGCKSNLVCIDEDAAYCLGSSDLCFRNEGKRICPRFCGGCEVCDNIVRDEYCEKYYDRCDEYNVKYLCSSTCKVCSELCRNKLGSDRVCNHFHKLYYCDKSNPNHEIMWDICHATCTSGCTNLYKY